MGLSQTRADKIKQPGRYADGRNLYLQVSAAGNRSWIFRYELRGRERIMGLGPCADFTLEEARERARLARQLLKDGIDPLDKAHEARAQAAAQAAKAITFAHATDSYYAKFCRMRLNDYVFPSIGALPVGTIDKALVLKCITPIWQQKHKTAVRTLRLVRGILDYAKVQGWRTGDNPAAWKGNIEHALPTLATDKHHPALPFSEIYEFMTKLRAEPGVAARALEFLILTAARTGEVREAHWSEIDLTAKVWTVPGERTKTGKEHRVPLSPRALELLKAAPRESYSDLVFIGDGSTNILESSTDIRLWPKADIPRCAAHVRFWGQSGHGLEIRKCLLLTQSGHGVVFPLKGVLSRFWRQWLSRPQWAKANICTNDGRIVRHTAAKHAPRLLSVHRSWMGLQ
jgi:integrase